MQCTIYYLSLRDFQCLIYTPKAIFATLTKNRNLIKFSLMKHLKILCTCTMLLLSVVTFAQSRITGSVSDSQSEPIIGANITVKGSSIGTITDINGHFTLDT